MKRKISIVISLSAIFFLMAIGFDSQAAGGSNTVYLPLVKYGNSASPTLDGIPLKVGSLFLPGEFEVSATDDANQIATAFLLNPFREFSITSVAYGESPTVENLPNATPGGAEIYRNALSDFRTQQGGNPQPAPAVLLLGQMIVGSYSIVELITDGETAQATLIVEWVVEAESHLWIIRIAHDLSDGTNPTVFLTSLQGLNIEISNTDVEQPSSMVTHLYGESYPISGVNLTTATLPLPSWWSGNCNVNNHSGSYPLGASYDDLVACGPLKSAQLVQFFAGAHGEYEWQCVELAMRYLYVKYDIDPYPGNGKDVVNNMPQQYIGSTFERITNGTPNHAPVSGDVISFGATTTYGHVAIVTSANVDNEGNGSIEILEQNWSQSGHRSLPVANWRVGGSMSVVNWLHSINFSGSWQEVGVGSASNGGISNNAGNSSAPSLALAPDGTPYVAWEDASSGNDEIYVRAWNGSNWAEVGVGSASGGGISNSVGISGEPFIAIAPDGTPYVAWLNNSNGNHEIYVRAWNGSSWAEVGVGSASGGGISNTVGYSLFPTLAFNSNGTPYVAWQEDGSGSEIYVRAWNGSSWAEVGVG
ncbi:MAG: CHAP domain-containing protein, partial [Anaerolineales bacterium]|nr:CHAP domain-containing protein [Anaerolineales bacterium]